jgi:hypothetical protein
MKVFHLNIAESRLSFVWFISIRLIFLKVILECFRVVKWFFEVYAVLWRCFKGDKI